MTDTSVMQDRIGQLCGQFKLPTMGAQSVARFTAAGHGDALATFLEVLEQEAEDRRHRRISRLRRESRLPSGKTWENLRARPSPPGAAAATGPAGPGQASSSAASTCWPSGCPAPARPTPCAPWATAWWKLANSVLFAPAYRLVQELLAAKRDLDLPRQLRKAGQLRLPAPRRPGLPAPGRRGNRRSSSPSSPNATSAGRWASRQTWSSRSGSASLPTPWPPPRRLTGSCTTPSSWSLTSPATGPTLPSNGARPRR